MLTFLTAQIMPSNVDVTTVLLCSCSLSAERRKHLCRSYMELVCYVPWSGTPDDTFLTAEQRAELSSVENDPEKDHRGVAFLHYHIVVFFV